jgi:hypothetical protein
VKLSEKQTRIAGWALVILAVLLPCRHFWPLDAGFYVDWPNHEWIVGYFGAYVRNHHAMPLVMNTTTAGGIVVPVFYGSLLYPVLGLFSSVMSPGIVLRLGAITMFALQFWTVSKALQAMSVPRYLARIIGCLVIWETYPLTNLFNRAAIVEFFATTLLVCALSALVLLFHATDSRARTRYAAGAMLALTLAAGSHPITAMYGGPVFVALVPVFWWLLRHDSARRKAIVRSLLPWLGLAAICVLPWFLAARQYANHMAVRSSAADVTVTAGWDDWQNRFFPLPRDPHVIPGVPIEKILTPYLDAQISVSLLIVFLALGVLAIVACRGRSRAPIVAFVVGLAFFAFFTWLSISLTGYSLFPKLAVMIQYAYRAVTYENLSLLLGIFLVTMTLRSVVDVPKLLAHRAVKLVAIATLVLAAVGVFVKLDHIAAIKTVEPDAHILSTKGERNTFVKLPATYYGLTAYTTDALVLQYIPVEAQGKVVPMGFQIETGHLFGQTKPMAVELAEPTWVMTDIQSFPWNQLVLDGKPVADMRTHFDQLTLLIPAGKHIVTAELVPPTSWWLLHTLSLVLVFSWIIFMIVATVRSRRLAAS